MSVVVMGVEIPKDCDSCWLPERICNLWLATDLNKRHSGCPLRPLPEKHGRLKDVDAIIEDIRKNSESYFADDFAHEWIERQPTIVEAEGEE